MTQLARRLAVTRQPLGRLGVIWRVRPALEDLPGQTSGAERSLDEADVPVFAGVAARHDRQGVDGIREVV